MRKTLLLLSLILLMAVSATASVTFHDPSEEAEFPYGETITHSFSVYGTDGTIELYIDGNFEESWSHCSAGCTQTYEYDKEYSSSETGDHTWDVVYYGSSDGSDDDPASRSYTIQTDAEAKNLIHTSPDDGATLTTDSVTFDYGVEEYSNYDGEVELRADTCSEDYETLSTDTTSSGTTNQYTHTEDYGDCYGTFDWYLYYTGNDGTTDETDIFKSFTIESDASQTDLTLHGPDDNEDFNGDTNQESEITYDFSVEGASGTVHLREDGTTIESWSHPGSSQTFTHTVSNDDGSYDWNVEYVGDDGSSVQSEVRSYEIEDYADRASVSTSSPTDGETFSTDEVVFDYGGSGPDGTIELYMDGSLIDSYTHSGGTSSSESHIESGISNGDHDFYAQYVGDDGSTRSSTTKTFTVDVPTDAEQTTLTHQNPSDGEAFVGSGSDVTFDVEKNGNDGSVELYLDGSEINTWNLDCSSCSESLSYTASVSAGSHSWYVEYVGSDGSTKTTSSDGFEVETYSEVSNITLGFPQQGQTYTSLPVDYNYSVEAYTGDFEIYRNDSLIYTESHSGSGSASYSYSESPSSGAYEYYIKYVGDDGSSKTTSTRSFKVDASTDADDTSITLDKPSDAASFTGLGYTVDFQYTVSGNSGTVDLYADTCSGDEVNVASDSYFGTDNTQFTNSETFDCTGSFDWYAEYTGDDGSTKTSSTQTLSVDSDSSTFNVDYISPADGYSTKPTELGFEFNASANSGTVELFVDGSSKQQWSHGGGEEGYSTTVSDLAVDNHTWHVEYTGDDGSTVSGSSQSFEVVSSEGPVINYDSSTSEGDQVRDWILVNVSVTDSDEVSQVVERFDGLNSSFSMNQGDYFWTNHTGLSTGEYSFKVFAEDSNGNWRSSELRTVSVEENEPVTISVVDPDNVTYSENNVPVDVLTSEPNGNSYSCSVSDGGSVIGGVNESSSTFKTTLSQSSNGTFLFSVDCEDEYGLSSSETVYYSVDTESSGDDGGTGGGPEEQVAEFVPEVYSVPFGSDVKRSFTVENLREQETSVSVTVPDSEQCSIFRVPNSADGQVFDSSGEYSLPEAVLGQRQSLSVPVQVSMPEQPRFEELRNGNGTIRCELNTGSTAGGTNALVLEIEPGSDPLAPLKRFIERIGTENGVSSLLNSLFVGVRGPIAVVLFWSSVLIGVYWWRNQ